VAQESFAQAWSTVAELAPERLAIVCGPRRLTFGDFATRAGALAHALHDDGLRAGDKVAIELVNSPEYLETFFAAQLLGCVPVNVNYRYVEHELAYLLDNSDTSAIVYHDEFADTVAGALRVRTDDRPIARYRVAHGDSGSEGASGARHYEDVVSSTAQGNAGSAGWMPPHAPGGDDLVFIYTGGTTGAPKAVMWRSGDLALALWQMARPGTEPPSARSTIERGRAAATVLPACPLMHGTGLFIALSTLSGGGTVVLIDKPRLDPVAVWDAVEREHVRVLTIVGDAFARPLLAALENEPGRWELGGLSAITSSGVTWSPETKRGLLAHLPGITLIDSVARSGWADPHRLLQGSREDRGHVPIGRRAPLLDSRRLRPHRARRHRHPARARQRVHQHRWREGLSRRSGAGAAFASFGVRLCRRGCRRRTLGRDGRRAGRAER
jgi:fatty-acyl-CoA synthase